MFGNTVDVTMSPSYQFTFQFDNTAVQSSFVAELGPLSVSVVADSALDCEYLLRSGFHLEGLSLPNLEQGVLPSLRVQGTFDCRAHGRIMTVILCWLVCRRVLDQTFNDVRSCRRCCRLAPPSTT